MTLSNVDERNACESGGTAFMCWSGVPWQVGPNLSYGFAAASGGNYRCGRCYQLQFTGGGQQGQNNSVLNGKMMIVQVINNGGVQANQFDLLIPGGGVGEFDACTNQWGSIATWARNTADFWPAVTATRTACARSARRSSPASRICWRVATGSLVGSAAPTIPR